MHVFFEVGLIAPKQDASRTHGGFARRPEAARRGKNTNLIRTTATESPKLAPFPVSLPFLPFLSPPAGPMCAPYPRGPNAGTRLHAAARKVFQATLPRTIRREKRLTYGAAAGKQAFRAQAAAASMQRCAPGQPGCTPAQAQQAQQGQKQVAHAAELRIEAAEKGPEAGEKGGRIVYQVNG